VFGSAGMASTVHTFDVREGWRGPDLNLLVSHCIVTRIGLDSGHFTGPSHLMPRFDLRQDDETLDPLASFKVLTVMCHPNKSLQREKMLGNILKGTGEGEPRRRPLTSEEFMAEVQRTDKRGAIAGGLLLAMMQLRSNGFGASLNQAIPLVAALLPSWTQPQGPYWSKECHVDHHPHNRAKMLKSYNEYRSVAHLWAALLHGQQHERQDIWPGSLQTLPTFIAYAETILDLACRLPSLARGRGFAMSRSEAWRFTVPNLQRVTLIASPLT
jgi:hypothetical protein